MSKIFISYRHEDSPYISATIYEKLGQRFGPDNIFFDIDSIPLGIDFRKYITDNVGKCDLLLVVIGDKWMDSVNNQGTRRLDDPLDFVRLEIEAAFERNIPVIPILVENAKIPPANKLPLSIQELSFRNAAELRSGRDLSEHLRRLVNDVESIVNKKVSTTSKTMDANNGNINSQKVGVNTNISANWNVLYWIPVLLLLNYVSPSFNGIQIVLPFLLPAVSGLLALQYGPRSIYAVAIGGSPHLIGFSGSWGTFVAEPGIFTLSILISYFLSSKDRFLKIHADNSRLRSILVALFFIILILPMNLSWWSVREGEQLLVTKLIITFTFSWMILAAGFYAGYTNVKQRNYLIVLCILCFVGLTLLNVSYVKSDNWKFFYSISIGSYLALILMYISGKLIHSRITNTRINDIKILVLTLCIIGYISYDSHWMVKSLVDFDAKGVYLRSFYLIAASGFLFGVFFIGHGIKTSLLLFSASIILVVFSSESGYGSRIVLTLPIMWYMYYKLGRKISTELIK